MQIDDNNTGRETARRLWSAVPDTPLHLPRKIPRARIAAAIAIPVTFALGFAAGILGVFHWQPPVSLVVLFMAGTLIAGQSKQFEQYILADSKRIAAVLVSGLFFTGWLVGLSWS